MALYHFNAKLVKRSEGRLATQVAAYKLGLPINCQRTGIKYNYAHNSRVMAQGIEASEDAPSWVFEPQRLWNAVEGREVRKNAQVLRDYELALPTELNTATHVKMVRQFARSIVEEFSVVVGWGIHKPRDYTDERSITAFLLISTRALEGGQFTRKVREMSVRPSALIIIEAHRELWAKIQNIELEAAGFDERVDHRSLKAQRAEALAMGDMKRATMLDREPTRKISQVEHRKLKTELLRLKRLKAQGEVIASDKSELPGSGD